MAGIVGIGAYVPRYRLERKLILRAMGWFNPATAGVAKGERAVANHDEDSLTLAVAAGRDALAAGTDAAAGVGALYLASTTLPYAERQNAAIVAAALDLPEGVRALDVGGTPRSGSEALLGALEAVRGAGPEQALVLGSDCRLGKMGGRSEHLFGDAASALLVGRHEVAAEWVASASRTADFGDARRGAGEPFARTWEERWIRDEGQTRLLGEVARECLTRAAVAPGDLARVVMAGVDARSAAGLLKAWGIPPERLQDPLLDRVGDTGSAAAGLLLAAALEQAAPGEKILLVGFGSGADALLFQTTPAVARVRPGLGVTGHLARRATLDSYEKYAAFRRLLPLELGPRGESMAPTAFSMLWRERRTILGLYGNRCTRCGTAQFPPLRSCVNPDCGSVDNHEPYRFAGRTGNIFTYTADNLAFSLDPPANYGLVDFAGGGRLFLDFTDCRPEELQVGLPMALTFRRKYLDEANAVHGYFWKACPAPRAAAPAAG